MNKMTKGALSIGLGAALLLGGGGTLAVWNQTVDTQAGTIAAGDLGLTAGTGTWSSNGTQITNINAYKIVPGETLTYSQPLAVKLAGDKMQAKITLDTSKVAANFTPKDITYSTLTLTDTAGKAMPAVLTPSTAKDVIASVSVTFDNSAPLSSIGATANLNTVSYKLEQMPVTATPAPTK